MKAKITMRNLFGLILSLVVLSGMSFFSCNSDQREKAEKPNIILILADDLGYGDVGFMGNNIIKEHPEIVEEMKTNLLKYLDSSRKSHNGDDYATSFETVNKFPGVICKELN